MQVAWQVKKFSELTPYEVYAILQLRNEVFVVEQQCIFQDADNNDQPCLHVMGWWQQQLVAYTRLVPAGIIYNIPSIGRVVTSPGVRKEGIGKNLMKISIENIYQLWGDTAIKIGAQLYLQSFYESFGFNRISDIYLEDGIAHIYMIKPPLLTATK